MRSGGLKIIWFSEDSNWKKFEYSKPGSPDYSLYTYRVRGFEYYHQKVQASRAQSLTAVTKNEFGEKSFSFVAPDGYFWTILG